MRTDAVKATRKTPAERLAARLVAQPSGCREWSGSTTADGYGQISIDRKLVYTHRFAWTLANGPIPPGIKVLHHCDNPPCCETDPSEAYPEGHLFLGTTADNNADMAAKGRNHQQKKSHCPARHEYTEANTRVTPRGHRECLTCETARSHARRRSAS